MDERLKVAFMRVTETMVAFSRWAADGGGRLKVAFVRISEMEATFSRKGGREGCQPPGVTMPWSKA
ncbi:hypothetical protein G419_03068 [Rhodococcus triatomae BKS 15-14]|nr:hypothetical protein G419_03068 [Rhodococcus triatomae BKS 15-14]